MHTTPHQRIVLADSSLLFVLFIALLGACAGGQGSEAEQRSPGDSDPNQSAAPFSNLSFRISNLDFSTLPEREAIFAEDLQDVVVSEDITVDHERFDTREDAPVRTVRRIFPQESGYEGFCEEITAYFFKSLTIEEGVTVHLTGENPIALVAVEDIDVMGNLFANATGHTPGPGAMLYDRNTSREGPAMDPGKGTRLRRGGHGGHHCGSGGTDGEASPYGRAGLEPLLAGSAGGAGESIENYGPNTSLVGGAGGGAMQLSAGAAVRLGENGTIHAGGGGGERAHAIITNQAGWRVYGPFDSAGSPDSFAAGGGSGGSILIEAPSVALRGAVASNGGYGGFMNPVDPIYQYFILDTYAEGIYDAYESRFSDPIDPSSNDEPAPKEKSAASFPISWTGALDDLRGAFGEQVDGRFGGSSTVSRSYRWSFLGPILQNITSRPEYRFAFFAGGGGGAGWIPLKTASGEPELGAEAVLSPYASTRCTTFTTLNAPQ